MTNTEIQSIVSEFNSWDISNAEISLWGFRKNKSKEGQLSYSAKWINTDDSLSSSLAAIFANYQNAYREAMPYNILAEPAETQFLHIEEDLTHASLLTTLLDRPQEEHQASVASDLNNMVGYVLRIKKGPLVSYAFKKTESSWKTKKSSSFLNVIYSDGELTLLEDKSFRIENKFDFIFFKNSILISSKKGFESLLDYKDDFKEAFDTLVTEPVFTSLFQSTQCITDYVGSNMLHLRRMKAVEIKGFYRDQNFLSAVRRVNASDNWGIIFDATGKIIATPETVKNIITILLDHRLKSELTQTTYDVQSTVQV